MGNYYYYFLIRQISGFGLITAIQAFALWMSWLEAMRSASSPSILDMSFALCGCMSARLRASRVSGSPIKRLVHKARVFRTIQELVRFWTEELEKPP
jgi:hypothetical protein